MDATQDATFLELSFGFILDGPLGTLRTSGQDDIGRPQDGVQVDSWCSDDGGGKNEVFV